ncbi:hypothetical protein D9758_018279 [Tetrapyrgos nigripes]|uniref:DUF7330 domain-containing protein n=1 Tax=Tetrapyrgos nigripes TaxID=182062 RepID=A0A8H5C0N5_9AGAR|nr:hypothetical protein D9758_018279 [Tetrapyrgos nigripes]
MSSTGTARALDPRSLGLPPDFIVVQEANWSQDLSQPAESASSPASVHSSNSGYQYEDDDSGTAVEDGSSTLTGIGSIRITQSDSSSAHATQDNLGRGVVKVEVVVDSSSSEESSISDWFRVCMMRREVRRKAKATLEGETERGKREGKEGHNASGVGIFFTHNVRNHRPTSGNGHYIEIIVTFPHIRTCSELAGSSSSRDSESRLKINNFETNLPGFLHQVDNLAPMMLFRSISLKAGPEAGREDAGADILVESISAKKANFQTSNASIEGCFTVSSYLNLETRNEKIRSSVLFEDHQDLDTNPETNLRGTRRGREGFSQLRMENSNGPISSSIILASPSRISKYQASTDSERGGNFSIQANTTNAPVNITFPIAPPYHNLQLNVSTVLGDVEVQLPETFEGRFDVNVSRPGNAGNPQDVDVVNVNDEANQTVDVDVALIERHSGARRRILEYERQDSTGISGWIFGSGEEEGKFRGEVKVGTSTGKALLKI